MNNDLGLAWDKVLKQLDVKDLQLLSGNNAFNKNDNRFVQQMNEMLLTRLNEVEILN